MVYDNPIYRYNFTILKLMCLFIIFCGLLLCLGFALTITPYAPYQHPTKKYISFCESGLSLWLGALIGLYDVICCIGSMIAFINPLRKLIKSILMTETTEEQRNDLRPLIKTGVKYAILTSATAISTFIMLLVSSLGCVWFGALDFVINMICMVLMTSYYNEARYYERLCFPVIKCSKCCAWFCCGYNEDLVALEDAVNKSTQSESNVNITIA